MAANVDSSNIELVDRPSHSRMDSSEIEILRPSHTRTELIRPSYPRIDSIQEIELVRPTYPRIGSTQNLTHRKVPDVPVHIMYGSETDPDRFPDGGLAANLVVLGCFVGLIADFGIANSMGAIQSYISTHQLLTEKETNVSWVFSLHLGVMYIGGVIFGELFDKFGAKRPLFAGMIIMCLGLIATAESKTLWQFILSFSVLTAIGTSIAMAPLISVISHWFLRKRAMAASIATVGGLVGSSCFAVMLQKLYGSVGFKWAIRILALICGACMMVLVILVKERKMEPTNIESTERTVSTPTNQNSTTSTITPDLGINPFSESTAEIISENVDSNTPKDGIFKTTLKFLQSALDFSILKDSRFVLLTLAVFLAEIVSMSTLTFLSSYAITLGVAEGRAYLLLTLVNVCGIPSRLVSGYGADKYGRFNVMIFTSFLTTIVVFAIWFPAKGNVTQLYIFAVLFGISTSAVILLIPACAGQICPAESFGKVYGTLYFFLGPLTILGMYFASIVIGKGNAQTYRHFVLYEGGLLVLCLISWIMARYTAVGWKICKF